MRKITKDTTVMEALSIHPAARALLKESGIRFIGRDANPMESLERVAKANGLSENQLATLVAKLNSTPSHSRGVSISLTENAAEELKALLRKKPGKKAMRLRLVSIGCAMYSYDMDFATKRMDSEAACSAKGITFFVEKRRLDFLNGLLIDYDPSNQGFVFHNPNMRQEKPDVVL